MPTVSKTDVTNQPSALLAMREHNTQVDHDSIVHLLNPTPEQQHRQRAYYLANVTMIDEKIGQILETLEARGYLDNAVVIFTSDHGDALGDHGHIQKWTMYDCITRVPAVVWAPGRLAGGRRLDGMCQMMDLGPTILALAGAAVPEAMEACSLMPALKGENWTGRDYVFAEHGRDGILRETAFMTMVRSRGWKLVHFLDTPEGQLFDLVHDPEESHNLWDVPSAADKRQELLGVLREWRIRSAYRTRTWAEGCR